MTTRIYEGTNQPGDGSQLQCRPDWADMRATRPRLWISVNLTDKTDSNHVRFSIEALVCAHVRQDRA
jgi:hypothetical protein